MISNISRSSFKRAFKFIVPPVLIYDLLQFMYSVTDSILLPFNSPSKKADVMLSTLLLFRAIALIASVAAVGYILYSTFYKDLMSGHSYKYYSLPYKKSSIIFSRTIPASAVTSLSAPVYILLFPFSNRIINNGDPRINEYFMENIAYCVSLYVILALVIFAACMLIVLTLVVSRSFDPKPSIIRAVLTLTIAILANAVLFVGVELLPLYDFPLCYPYADIVLAAVTLLILVIEAAVMMCMIKKLADRKMDVL